MPLDFQEFTTPVAVGTALIVIAALWKLGGRAVRYLTRAASKQIAEDILGFLTPAIRTVARKEVDALIDKKLQPIYDQLRPNGGDSLHDRLTSVEHALHTLNLNTTRWEPPDGTPV